jgi:O-antigen/teichoic acid export membrane protein
VPPKIARLAGFGAFAACAGIAALFVLFVLVTRPSEWSGMDGTMRFLSWFSVAGVLLSLLGVHLIIGRRLLALSRGENPPA